MVANISYLYFLFAASPAWDRDEGALAHTPTRKRYIG